MSLVIKFYFISSMLNMFWTLIDPSSGACDFSPTHIETRTHDQCGDTIEKRRLLMMDVFMSKTC